MDGSPKVNTPWSAVEVERLHRMVAEQGLGDWQTKAEQWREEARQHRAKHGGPEPTERTAKSIEGKWYKELREMKAARQSSTDAKGSKAQHSVAKNKGSAKGRDGAGGAHGTNGSGTNGGQERACALLAQQPQRDQQAGGLAGALSTMKHEVYSGYLGDEHLGASPDTTNNMPKSKGRHAAVKRQPKRHRQDANEGTSPRKQHQRTAGLRYSETDWTNAWSLNDIVDALDYVGNWVPAKVIAVEEHRVKVHFKGWNKIHDEWIEVKDQIAPSGKHTSRSDQAQQPASALEFDDAASRGQSVGLWNPERSHACYTMLASGPTAMIATPEPGPTCVWAVGFPLLSSSHCPTGRHYFEVEVLIPGPFTSEAFVGVASESFDGAVDSTDRLAPRGAWFWKIRGPGQKARGKLVSNGCELSNTTESVKDNARARVKVEIDYALQLVQFHLNGDFVGSISAKASESANRADSSSAACRLSSRRRGPGRYTPQGFDGPVVPIAAVCNEGVSLQLLHQGATTSFVPKEMSAASRYLRQLGKRTQQMLVEDIAYKEEKVAKMSLAEFHQDLMRRFQDDNTEGLVTSTVRNEFYTHAFQDFARALRTTAMTTKKKSWKEKFIAVDAGCGPKALLTQMFIKQMQLKNAAALLSVTAVDVVESFVSQAADEICRNGLNDIVTVVLSDAAECDQLYSADLVLHEVFGNIASSESFIAFAKNVGPNTRVLPDTSATLFQLCTVSEHTINANSSCIGHQDGLIIGQKVATVRSLQLDKCALVSNGVGVLELYANGGTPGAARDWAKERSQCWTSKFNVQTSGKIHALGCFIFLGHGEPETGPKSTRSQGRAHVFMELPIDAKREGEQHALKFPKRACSFTNDQRDGATDRAWRNPMILLEKELRVQQGDTVTVKTEVGRLGQHGPTYKVEIFVERSNGLRADSIFQEFNQKHLYPYVCKRGDEETRPKHAYTRSSLPFTPVRWEDLEPACRYTGTLDYTDEDVQEFLQKNFPKGIPPTREAQKAIADYKLSKSTIQQAINNPTRLQSLVAIGQIDDVKHPCWKDKKATGRQHPSYLLYAKQDLAVNTVLGEYTGLVQLSEVVNAIERKQVLGYEVPLGFNCAYH
eukprot:COSAG02_NODE_1093_length_14617_cov_13.078661_6_plen_1109_part_00